MPMLHTHQMGYCVTHRCTPPQHRSGMEHAFYLSGLGSTRPKPRDAALSVYLFTDSERSEGSVLLIGVRILHFAQDDINARAAPAPLAPAPGTPRAAWAPGRPGREHGPTRSRPADRGPRPPGCRAPSAARPGESCSACARGG